MFPRPRYSVSREVPVLPRLLALSQFITECGCQIWMGRLDNKGYGQIWTGGKYRRTSRVAYAIHCGAIPKGLCVLHRCDVPACINPEHLFLGTQADNTRDALLKGRLVVFGRKISARSA